MMPDGTIIRLLGDQSRRAACDLVMRAPEGWLAEISKPKRTLRQSSKFWATCDEVAHTDITWSGTRQSKKGWHDLFLCGYLVIKEEPPRATIGLEGELICLSKHSSDLKESEFSELLDYQAAWCAMHNVSLRRQD